MAKNLTTTYDDLLSPAQVAKAFSVEVKTVTRWAKSGKLPSIRTPGGHRRYRRADIAALLNWDES